MTAAARRYGLLGDPVAHSLSPSLYRSAFDLLGIRARYHAVRVRAGDFSRLRQAMRDLAASGGGNITIPHKTAAVAALDLRTPAVERTGACNCFWLDERGRLSGDNTDAAGFLAACADFGAVHLSGASVLLLGAGGAARAVASACADAAVDSLEVRNRTADRARRMVRDLGIEGWASVVPASEHTRRRHDLVVNATSLGLHSEDPLPTSLDAGRHGAAFDLVYGAGGTAWTRHAADLGIPAVDGRWMLVYQAVLSLERWGIDPGDREEVTRAMLEVADARLSDGAREERPPPL